MDAAHQLVAVDAAVHAQVAAPQVQVGAADAAARDLHEDAPGLDLGDRQLPDLEAVVVDEDRRPAAFSHWRNAALIRPQDSVRPSGSPPSEQSLDSGSSAQRRMRQVWSSSWRSLKVIT